MTCKHCGQKLSKGQTVCPSCGSPVKHKNRTLASALFVILFVLIVSLALIFLNLKSRGDLPELNLTNIRSLFVREKAEEPAETPVLPDAESAEEEQEVAEAEPAPAETPAEEAEAEPEAAPEAEAEPTLAAEPEAEGEPAASLGTEVESEVTEGEAESVELVAEAPTADDRTVLDESTVAEAEPADVSPLEAYCACERENFARLLKAWAACRTADEEAADKLLRGDGELLLRLCLNYLAEDASPAGPETTAWTLFKETVSDGETPAVSPFRELLTSEDFDALLDSYLELILSNITEVTESREAVEAEGIVETCTAYCAELDSAATHRIVSSLIGTLRWDERIEEILSAEAYSAFLDRLDELDYALDTGDLVPDSALSMVLYVDDSGALRGRSLQYAQENRPEHLLFALPHDGESFGLELNLRLDRVLVLSGRGSAAEDGLHGSFRFLQDGKALGRVTVDPAA